MQLENQQYRYERKFLCPSSDLIEVERIIRGLPGGFSQIYCKRTINNMYFDDFDLTSFLDSIEGSEDRLKIRIRWYGDLFSDSTDAFLELKRKKGVVGMKDRFDLGKLSFFELSSTDFFKKIVYKKVFNDSMLDGLSSFKKILLNSYDRKYFESFDKRFRITIDSDLKWYYPNYKKGFNSEFSNNNTIVEMKYNVDDDISADMISSAMPFRWQKIRNIHME